MTRCSIAREKLAAQGREALEHDEELREHVAECPSCGRFLASLEAVDAGLGSLPAHQPDEAVVARTLEAVRSLSRPTPPKRRLAPLWAGAVAAGILVFVTAGVIMMPASRYSQRDSAVAPLALQRGASEQKADASAGAKSLDSIASRYIKGSTTLDPQEQGQPLYKLDTEHRFAEQARQLNEELREFRREQDWLVANLEPQPVAPERPSESFRLLEKAMKPQKLARAKQPEVSALSQGLGSTVTASSPVGGFADEDGDLRELGSDEEAALIASAGPELKDDGRIGREIKAESTLRYLPKSKEDASSVDGKFVLGGSSNGPTEDDFTEMPATVVARQAGEAGEASAIPVATARQRARDFLTAGQVLEGVRLQPASGYWANTYVPGDPSIRYLAARLAGWPGVPGASVVGAAVQAVGPNWQPFDAPANAALNAYLHADRAALDGPTRLRIQVGLKAAERKGGHRPAMNLGVVLDMRGRVSGAARAGIKALLSALHRLRQPGDRFSLTVAGQVGGVLVPSGEFRHGTLQIALARLFDESIANPTPMALTQAFELATESIRRGDDPSATLGASTVLLVTTTPIDTEREALEALVHANALRGITLSAVAVGSGWQREAIDRLVLLGQGHRRILSSPDEADQLLGRELRAASRAVARAVRLRIRLAPGVRLVEVLGSERLEVVQVNRVREAEQSIDTRLSRNLGIQADRGEDEEGIQIIIPGFFAGDSHVVLLDVIADRAGPIADLTVRYKDLVFLRNGVARARLELPAGQRARGPLELNVLKNQLAQAFSDVARSASRHLASGRAQRAAAGLRDLHTLLHGLRLEVGGWADDAELISDQRTLIAYVDLIEAPMADPERRRLADALHYVALRRLLPPYD